MDKHLPLQVDEHTLAEFSGRDAVVTTEDFGENRRIVAANLLTHTLHGFFAINQQTCSALHHEAGMGRFWRVAQEKTPLPCCTNHISE